MWRLSIVSHEVLFNLIEFSFFLSELCVENVKSGWECGCTPNLEVK